MSGGVVEAGATGFQALVGAGRTRFGGDADRVSGGLTDGGGGGERQDGDRDGFNQWEDNAAHVTLGKDTSALLAYALILELRHSIMGKLRETGGRLERERSTSLNDLLYVLTHISHYTENHLHVRLILTVYHNQLTSIGLTYLNKGRRNITCDQIQE